MAPEKEEKLYREIQRCKNLQEHGNSPEAYRIARRIRSIAAKDGHQELEALALGVLGHSYRMQGKGAAKDECFQRIEELYPHIPKGKNYTEICRVLGAYYREKNNYVLAVERLNEARYMAEKIGDAQAESAALHSLGTTLTASGNYQTALQVLFRAISLALQKKLMKNVSGCYAQISNVYAYIVDYDKALHYAQKAVELAKKHGNALEKASCLEILGWAYRYKGNRKVSNRCFRQSITLREKIGNMTRVPVVCVGLGMNYREDKNYSKALHLFDKAYTMAEQSGNTLVIARILHQIARVWQDQKKYTEAIAKEQKAIELFQTMGEHLYDMRFCHKIISELYEALGNHKEAYKHRVQVGVINEKRNLIEQQRAIITTEVEEVLQRMEKEHGYIEERTHRAQRQKEEKEGLLQEALVKVKQTAEVLKNVQESIAPLVHSTDEKVKEMALALYKSLANAFKAGKHIASEKYFDTSYQEYIQRLFLRCPALTPAEMKVCVMIKLDYSTSKISRILCLSELTIKTHRAHIRKKLGLYHQDNLLNVLMGI